MLNPFPSLLAYSMLAPFILRLVLAFIVIDLGILKFNKEKHRWNQTLAALHLNPANLVRQILGGVEVIGGLMLVFGVYTQIAALAFVILFGAEFYIEWKDKSILKRDLVFYLLVMVISLSILLTGAGAFAFDIPL
ncbi:MAG: hypothetical protein JWL80_138 [Parcubacteria group bacterium]|nr:hypothetical protein [Parcubacteria group bacterium]